MPNLEEPAFGGRERLVSSRGELINIDRSGSEIAVVVAAANGEALVRAAINFRSEDAGVELLLSPNERYLALYLFSGQSEEGYELFYFRPHLAHICSFGLVFGEGYGPLFSSDERWFGQGMVDKPGALPPGRGRGAFARWRMSDRLGDASRPTIAARSSDELQFSGPRRSRVSP